MDLAVNSLEQRAAKAMLPGFSSYRALDEDGPVVITRGEGIHVIDIQGRRYLEANSGLWNAMAGFSPAALVDAAVEQLRRLPVYHGFFGRVPDSSVALAEKLIAIAPMPMSKVFFANSGSEANDTVVKLLWAIAEGEGWPARRKIITRVNGYHGVTAVTASMTGKQYVRAFGLPLGGFLWADCPHHWRHARDGESEAAFSARLAESLDALIRREGAETIAGFFAEPVLGAGGVIPPPEGYFEAIQPVLRQHSIPLVADEVITGFGRTGSMWGCQTYDIRPDIVVASKCLTGGIYPLSAILLSGEIADRLMRATAAYDEFPHGFTAGAHPVACAVGLRAVEMVENGLLDNVRRLAPHFQRRLKAMERFDAVGEARGVGLMGALELVHDRAGKTPFPDAVGIGDRVARKALGHGLICRPIGQAIVLAPPFIIDEAGIDTLFDALERTLDEVMADVHS